MAVKLIYHVLAMLLSWMVLHARSDTTKRSKSSCCAINWACCSDAYPRRGQLERLRWFTQATSVAVA